MVITLQLDARLFAVLFHWLQGLMPLLMRLLITSGSSNRMTIFSFPLVLSSFHFLLSATILASFMQTSWHFASQKLSKVEQQFAQYLGLFQVQKTIANTTDWRVIHRQNFVSLARVDFWFDYFHAFGIVQKRIRRSQKKFTRMKRSKSLWFNYIFCLVRSDRNIDVTQKTLATGSTV